MTFGSLTPLIGAWVGFGLFAIGAGVTVALHADRLSHRRRLATMANYFEHVLELPLAFHTATHSGRVLKVMLEGSNGMAWLWLGFFRDHLAALIALLVLLPLTVFLNWRARRSAAAPGSSASQATNIDTPKNSAQLCV